MGYEGLIVKSVKHSKFLSKQDVCSILGLTSRQLSLSIKLGLIPVALHLSRKTMFFDPSVIELFKVKQGSKNED